MHRNKLLRENKMIFDGIIFGTYFSGSIFILLATLFRYSVGAGKSGKLLKMINAIKVVGVSKKTPNAFGMLIQCTGVLWILLGTVYGIVQRRCVIEGIQDNCLILFVLIGPLILLMGLITFLRRFYWELPD